MQNPSCLRGFPIGCRRPRFSPCCLRRVQVGKSQIHQIQQPPGLICHIKIPHQSFKSGGTPIIADRSIFCHGRRFCVSSSFIPGFLPGSQFRKNDCQHFGLRVRFYQMAGVAVQLICRSIPAGHHKGPNDQIINAVPDIGQCKRRIGADIRFLYAEIIPDSRIDRKSAEILRSGRAPAFPLLPGRIFRCVILFPCFLKFDRFDLRSLASFALPRNAALFMSDCFVLTKPLCNLSMHHHTYKDTCRFVIRTSLC